MAKNITKGKIGNALTSTANDHVVAVANDIYDETLDKYQSQINDEVEQSVFVEIHDPEEEVPQPEFINVEDATYAYNWKSTDAPATDGKTQGNLKDLYNNTLKQDQKLSELELNTVVTIIGINDSYSSIKPQAEWNVGEYYFDTAKKCVRKCIENTTSIKFQNLNLNLIRDDEKIYLVNEGILQIYASYRRVPFYTDKATTRERIYSRDRSLNMILSYNNGVKWVTELYIGDTTETANWRRNVNWIEIASVNDITELKAYTDNLVSSAVNSAVSPINEKVSLLSYYEKYANHVSTLNASKWTSTYATTSIYDGHLRIIPDGTNAAFNAKFNTDIELKQGHKIYVKATLRNNNTLANLRLRMEGSVTKNTSDIVTIDNVAVGSRTLYGIFSQSNQTGNAVFVVYGLYSTAGIKSSLYVDDAVCLDLTAIFGAGNEPSLDEFENIIGQYANEKTNPIEYLNDDVLRLMSIKYKEDKGRFYAEYETIEIPSAIDDFPVNRLKLIATKKDNYHCYHNPPIETPQDRGYLYAEEETNKLYYSANVYNRPKYLCDWNTELAYGETIDKWMAIISKEGDIIFVPQGKVGGSSKTTIYKPIVYPHGDYSHPMKVEVDSSVTLGGMTTDNNACVFSYGDFILFAEYRANGRSDLNGTPQRIWKISAPYNRPQDWKVVHQFEYLNTGDVEADPTIDTTGKITHWHTVTYDHYSGVFYANTGDHDRLCRVLKSEDLGETWTEIKGGSQMWRTLGYIFTDDACYWGTDADSVFHNLYRADRGADGKIDFNTTRVLTNLGRNGQRTYCNCEVREPHGILILERAEPRTDGLFDIPFWSFDDEKLYYLPQQRALLDDPIVINQHRYGFGDHAHTYYQSVQEDGIICGASSYDRSMTLNMLNNRSENKLGVVKIKVISCYK